ncbi:MAG: hypothetical protein PF795_00625 [Kiritimatiellae bacterium]|nr:hypothetical protein [Kiritimatiellia bacterium]
MWHWIETHAEVLSLLVGGSFVVLVATFALIPIMISRLQAGYFDNPYHQPLENLKHRPFLRASLLLLKNALGLILVLAGLAMLVLPGQGLLTLFVAMILLDFPGKFSLKKKIIRLPHLRRIINQFRIRHGKDPFVFRDEISVPQSHTRG